MHTTEIKRFETAKPVFDTTFLEIENRIAVLRA